MSGKSLKRGEVIAAIAVLLLSALFVTGSVSALTPQKGSISFVLIYKDAENSSLSDFLGNVKTYLFDMNGSYIQNYTSQSNGIVIFNNVEYGNYVIKTDTVRVGNYIYASNFSIVRVDSSGQHLISGGEFTNITVLRYPLDHYLNITVEEDGQPISADVYLFFKSYCFSSMLSTSNNNFTVPFGTVDVKIVYWEGGVKKSYYKDVYIAKNEKYLNLTIDVNNYKRIMGTVTSGTKIVDTNLHIILINKTNQQIWSVLNFTGGAFSFYLPSLNYKMVVTADGYDIATRDVTESFMTIDLNTTVNRRKYELSFSSDMKWINITKVIDISNKTILYSLPYNNTGVLYYQLKLLGWNTDKLQTYLVNQYHEYTDKLISVDGNVYEVYSIDTPGWYSIDPAQEEFRLVQTIHYRNLDISKSTLLSDGKIDLLLYAKRNDIKGAEIKYNYTIKLPSDLERSNEIYGAEVVNYTGTISIWGVENTPIMIILKKRVSPEIILDKLVIGWANMTNVNHVVNQSANNYTIVIPSYKDVWFNASKMVYDKVRSITDAENTTFNWSIDGTLKFSGKGVYNISYNFKTGKHIINVVATDVGGNTNETNITVLADGYWPSVNIKIKTTDGKVIATLRTNRTYPSRVDYNISGTASHAWMNSTSHIVSIKTSLVVNESEEIIYDASNTTDTYNGVNDTHLPVIVEWNFNGNKSTGLNRSFAFDKPTRDGPYYVNVTLRDSVNNTIIISIPVRVRDITKPVVYLNFTVNGKNVNEVKEGENITLNATGTYDPENGTIASYNWTIKNSTYAIINESSGIFTVVNGSFSGNNVTLVFHQYGTYYIILNVTDGAGNYNVVNKTLRVTPVRPDLTLNSVDIKGDRVEGSALTFTVNVSNSGNIPAEKYWIAIYVNGKVVRNESFEDLKNGSFTIKELKWTPNAPGLYHLKIVVWCPNEPASYRSDNVKEMTITIQEAPWKLPAMVLGSIAIIAFIGYLGWKYMQKKKESKKFKKKSKTKKEREKKSKE